MKLMWTLTDVKQHLHVILRLAPLMIFTRIGFYLFGVADLAFLTRINTDEVAYYVLGLGFYIPVLIAGVGLLFGSVISMGHARGANNLIEVGAIWRRSIPFTIVLSIIFSLGLCFSEVILLFMRQSPFLAKGGAEVAYTFILSIFPMLLFTACCFFLETTDRPYIALYIVIGANLANILGNYICVYVLQDISFFYSAKGIVLVTGCVRLFMALIIVGYIIWDKANDIYGIGLKPKDGWIKGGRSQRKHGYFTGFSHILETSTSTIMNMFAGWLGAQALSVYGVGYNILGLVFMCNIGLSATLAIQVGLAHGRQDYNDRTLVGYLGLIMTLLLSILMASIVFIFRQDILNIYLDNQELIKQVLPILLIVVFIIPFDGLHLILGAILRGAGDDILPMMSVVIGFLCISVPVGWYLSHGLDMGVVGLFYGFMIGSAVAFLIKLVRWVQISHKDTQPRHASKSNGNGVGL